MLKQIAEFRSVVPPGTNFGRIYQLGRRVFFDYGDTTGARLRWGAVQIDLDSGRVAAPLLLPLGDVAPDIDGYAAPVAQGRSAIAFYFSENAPYAPDRDVLCVYEKEDGRWSLHRRASHYPALAIGRVPGASWLVHLLETGDTPQLEFIDLDALGASVRFPIDRYEKAQAVAVNAAKTHFAVAHAGGLTCSRFAGGVEASWPLKEHTRQLWFAEDDLAIFSATNRAVSLHQWGGGVSQFEVPDSRVWSINLRSRTAFFVRLRTHDFVELDLSNGRPRSSGQLPSGHLNAVDLTSRLVANFAWEEEAVRVFELP